MLTGSAPDQIYRSGGWFESGALLNELQHGAARRTSPHFVAELFPPYAYPRPLPNMFGDEQLLNRLREHHDAVERHYAQGPACALVRVDDAYVCGPVVYAHGEHPLRILYETYRPNERHLLGLRPLAELEKGSRFEVDPDTLVFYLGSAGSHNYGHWLVDDLPRLKAIANLRALHPHRRITVVIHSFGGTIDRVRLESIALMLRSDPLTNIDFIDFDKPMRFTNLYYATPVSYHPHLKSPEALSFVAEHSIDRDLGQSDTSANPPRILVLRRPERGRGIVNAEEVYRLVERLGFNVVEPEGLSFVDQVKTFASARVVVGCMGAAMTNTLFSRPGTRILYLAPEEWTETFYWDIAAACRHEYSVLYGPSTDVDQRPHLRSFSINLDQLARCLDRVGVVEAL